jgi:LemA protein
MAIVAVLAISVVGIYNRLVNQKNSAAAAWHQIDVQLTRRADLVGNLVETVKGYAAHEKTVLEDVTNARASVAASKTPAQASEASSGLELALSRLFAVAENYPNLKANTNFLELQAQLQEIESRLAAAREYYNETVRRYNIACESFPANIFAATFGFIPREFFTVAPTKVEPPKVSFS